MNINTIKTNLIKTQGIIIFEKKEKEYDKLITILSNNLGKIFVWVNGCRKATSKNVGKAQIFVFANFELITSKKGYTLQNIEIIESFNTLSENYYDTFYAFYFADVINYISLENEEGRALVKILYYSYRALLNKNIDNKLVQRIFELKILQYNGTYEEIVDEKIKIVWNYVIAKPIEIVYNFNLNDNTFNIFSNEVEREWKKYIDKNFNSRRYLL